MNRVFVSGHLGQDPEAKVIGNSKTVYKLNLAVMESYKDKNGEWINNTNWLNVVSYADLSDYKKGDKIMVEGKITTREFKDKSDKLIKIIEVQAQQIFKLQKKDNSNGNVNFNTNNEDNLPF